MNKEQILSHLDFKSFYKSLVINFKENGNNQATGLCPYHDDTSPSLSINLKNGLYNCFACKAKGDVFKFYQDYKKVDFKTALKEIAEMQGISEPSPQGKVVAAFEYKDSEGKTLYIKERMEPGRNGKSKEFIFKRLEGDKWITGRGGDPVLYNLPELSKSKYVFIVEGEAKADLLMKWGLTATCLNSGANSPFKYEYLKYFEGKEKVIILPDNDNPGKGYANKIASALHGKVEKIKVVELPDLKEAEDIKNWAKVEGNNKERLLEIVKASPEWQPPKEIEVADEKEIEPEENPWTFPDTVWRGIFDTYRQAMVNTTWASDVTHFMALWAVVSAKLKRRVRFPYGMDLYPNGYLIYFGDTGDKKTTATSKATSLLADDTTIKILQGIGSGEGLTDWLKSEDNTVSHFLYLSELSELLQKGKWDGATLKAVLTHIYDCPPVYEAPFRKNPIKIIEPTLTMLACTTPTWFWKDLTELDIHGGFANRILYLTGQPKEPIARPQKPDAILLNKVRRHIEDAVKTLPAYTLEIELDTQASRLWDEFYIEWVKEEWPPLVKEAVKRVDAYILKLAMVYAVLEGTTPHITYDQLASAIQVGYYSAKCTEKLITKHQWKSRTVKLEERIIEELKKRDCTRRLLQRTAGQNCESWLFNKAIDGMVKAEGIYEREGNRKGQYVYSLKYQ